ncbi:GtrA family protein [Candidatus Xianfuyuplasma coldseepsis]|uniref:GtrA family protein n=1 Tax=Candidatus Xianfuyuplasma coldseepsis TaxID=2782163 RepID=A0A7L7KR16_9MOLU|nr:GtrA family protein [Xianfuyuplasma coldseepsis]QMS85127.1 GtrA family protein [Xianfuyuplasma coldseepsis]
MKQRRQLLLFIIFSASAGLVQFLVFVLLFELFHFGYWLAYVPSIISLVIWNTYWNRKYTFQSDLLFRTMVMKLMLFYVFFIPLSTIFGDVLTKNSWNEYLVLGMTMIINLSFAFLYNKYYIYKK